MPHADPIAHGEHVMTVCNACRYCEQFCPVFPAMESRLTFADGGSRVSRQPVPQLRRVSLRLPVRAAARVRHQRAEDAGGDSRAFVRGVLLAVVPVERLQASQPADRPRSRRRTDRGDVRRRSDRQRRRVPAASWPPATSTASFRTTSWSRSSEAWVCSSSLRSGSALPGSGATCGAARRTARPLPISPARSRDVLTLRHLHGGGVDCTSAEEQRAPLRRWFHHCTFYGFLLCFASTSVAALYHSVFGWLAPYAYASLPVLLGMAGGAGLLVGPAGLLMLRATARPGARRSRPARPGRVVHRAACSSPA